jgi:hypothetical protein
MKENNQNRRNKMIEITGVDLIKFVKKVYDLSVPQGLGFLHYTEEPLTDEEAKSCIFKEPFIVSMDYVKGRSCKMNVTKENGKLFIPDRWYDHTDTQLEELLWTFKIEMPSKKTHNIACNCIDCRKKRGKL